MIITFGILKKALEIVPENTPAVLELRIVAAGEIPIQIKEIGLVRKVFIDSNTKLREDTFCELQIDASSEIRLTAGELLKLTNASKVLISNSLLVKVYYNFLNYELVNIKFLDNKLTLICE